MVLGLYPALGPVRYVVDGTIAGVGARCITRITYSRCYLLIARSCELPRILSTTKFVKLRAGCHRKGGCYVGQRSGKHEGEDDDNDEYALSRVHADPHPRALEPPRGIGGENDVPQGGGDRPRLVQMVEGEQYPAGDEIAPSEAPRIRGSRSPRKSSSSPSTVLKTTSTTTTANQPQAPLKNS